MPTRQAGHATAYGSGRSARTGRRMRSATAATGQPARTRTQTLHPLQRHKAHRASVTLASRYLAPTKASTIGPVPSRGGRMSLPPFHLAFPVDDLVAARRFYGDLLGCPEGRSADEWIDFDLHGHQIVAHLAPQRLRDRATNEVDGEHVPVPHFGIVLPMDDWKRLA